MQRLAGILSRFGWNLCVGLPVGPPAAATAGSPVCHRAIEAALGLLDTQR
jgi:hypothetical protein